MHHLKIILRSRACSAGRAPVASEFVQFNHTPEPSPALF